MIAPPSIARLIELRKAAGLGELTADTHHTRRDAGRNHGFIRAAGELVSVGAVVLGVEGMSEDKGRARLALIVAAVNAIPLIERMAAALTWIECFADVRSQDDSKTFARVNRGALRTIRERARAALAPEPPDSEANRIARAALNRGDRNV